MGFKSKKYYFNQVLEEYLFCKKILGAKCYKKVVFKKQKDFFDGYLKFELNEENKDLISINNEFDDLYNSYQYKRVEHLDFINNVNIDKNTHIFYGIMIGLSLVFNIILICNLYFKSFYILIFALLLLLVPLVFYIYKIFLYKNKEKIIKSKEKKVKESIDVLKKKMLFILKNSPLYKNEDLSSLFIHEEIFEEEENNDKTIDLEIKISKEDLKN